MIMHKNKQAGMFQVLVMVLELERKENIVKVDRCEPAKDHPTIKSVFSLKHKDGGFVNSKNLPQLNVTLSFYRKLRVGLLIRIHYHHGRCVELMEENGVRYGEFSPCSEMTDRGLIVQSLQRIPLKFTKCCMIVHTLVNYGMDEHPNLDGYNILRRDLVHVWGASIGLLFL